MWFSLSVLVLLLGFSLIVIGLQLGYRNSQQASSFFLFGIIVFSLGTLSIVIYWVDF